LLIWALALVAVAVAVEGASGSLIGLIAPLTARFAPGAGSPPGMGVPSIALVDALLLLSMGLLAAPLLIPPRIHARAQGVVTLLVALPVIGGGIAAAFTALAKALLMLVLLFAFPFGTIIYLARYGHFDRSSAAAVLAVVWTLKLTAAVLLVLAHQRLIAIKGLVLLLATSLAMGLVVAFLHAFPPRLLASITDAVAAIVGGIVAAIWAIILVIGSIPGIVKAIRVDK
jgi:hypothetical protein